MSTENTEETYGPTTVECPYCETDQEIEAGPTRLTFIQHGDCPWIAVDLETGDVAKADPDEERPYDAEEATIGKSIVGGGEDQP